MKMEIYRTHPSVRIKGTEDNYEPVTCNISGCLKSNIHLHCPFCVKSESFYDPVILKAHYRVKHVDKGIEFAGLKILRCCDNCMIVGSIKGNKEFKGAHWHCYNCRNGFNRRDEALKHYKTHFRNPMTTFQIQITHDINQMMEMTSQAQNQQLTTVGNNSAPHAMSSWIMSTETVVSSPSDGIEETNVDGRIFVTNSEHMTGHQSEQVGEVEGFENAQYYIVGEDGQLTAADNQEAAMMPADTQHVEISESDIQSEGSPLALKYALLEKEFNALKNEKETMESLYKDMVQKLEAEVEAQQTKISELQEREQFLMAQVDQLKDGSHVDDLLNEMKNKQEELVNQYMFKLKKKVADPDINAVSIETNNKLVHLNDTETVLQTSPVSVNTSKGISVTPIKFPQSFSNVPTSEMNKKIIYIKQEDGPLKRMDSAKLTSSPPMKTIIVQQVPKVHNSVHKRTGLVKIKAENTQSKVNSISNKLPLSKLFEIQNKGEKKTANSNSQVVVVVEPQRLTTPQNVLLSEQGITMEGNVVGTSDIVLKDNVSSISGTTGLSRSEITGTELTEVMENPEEIHETEENLSNITNTVENHQPTVTEQEDSSSPVPMLSDHENISTVSECSVSDTNGAIQSYNEFEQNKTVDYSEEIDEIDKERVTNKVVIEFPDDKEGTDKQVVIKRKKSVSDLSLTSSISNRPKRQCKAPVKEYFDI